MINKKVYKYPEHEKSIGDGICYGLAKSFNLNEKNEKIVRYILRTIFVISGLAIIGVAVYGWLSFVMIEHGEKDDKKFLEKVRTNPYLNYIIFSFIIMIFLLGVIPTSQGPLSQKGLASSPVKEYLSETIKNPGSLDIIGTTDVEKINKNKYAQKVKYRAENSFGGNTIETKTFIMKKVDGDYKVIYAK